MDETLLIATTFARSIDDLLVVSGRLLVATFVTLGTLLRILRDRLLEGIHTMIRDPLFSLNLRSGDVGLCLLVEGRLLVRLSDVIAGRPQGLSEVSLECSSRRAQLGAGFGPLLPHCL